MEPAGTGLGLAIVRGLVERRTPAGCGWREPQDGEGARFAFTLPARGGPRPGTEGRDRGSRTAADRDSPDGAACGGSARRASQVLGFSAGPGSSPATTWTSMLATVRIRRRSVRELLCRALRCTRISVMRWSRA